MRLTLRSVVLSLAAAALVASCRGGDGKPTASPPDSATSSAAATGTVAPATSTNPPATAAAITPEPAGSSTAATATAAPPPQTSGGDAPPALPPAIAQVLADVAGIRGLTPPPALRANTVPRAELPALLDSLITGHDRDLLAKTTTLYRLLGHFTNDQDYLSIYSTFGATGILGLYSPLDDELWIVSDSGAAGLDDLSRTERETLAHELVHALQDYHFQLDRVFREVESDPDRSLAYTAAVEGDAVVHEGLYSDKFTMVPLAGRLMLVGTASAVAPTVPQSFIREIFFPYTTGADWVRAVRSAGGTAAVDGYLRNPPTSTAIVLHPELGFSGFTPDEVGLPRLEASLGAGWAWDSGGTLGEFQVGNYIQLGRPAGASQAAAAGWRGDHFDVYTDGSDSAGVFHLRFASAAEAAEFTGTHQRMLEGRALSSGASGQFVMFELPEGKWTATAPGAGADVFFAIATSEALARSAAGLIAGS